MCEHHGIFAPMYDDDLCDFYCDAEVYWSTYGDLLRVIAPRNWVIF